MSFFNALERSFVRKLFFSDKLYYTYVFFRAHKKLINWSEPKSFSEKVFWRKLYQFQDLFSLCSDKYKVRDYVKSKSDACDLIPLLGVFDSWDDIDFDSLPKSFVIKTTHDSGGVCLIHNKLTHNFSQARDIIELSLSTNYAEKNREVHYSNITPRIIIESLLLVNNRVPHDIKVHCFNGIPTFIQVANPSHTCNDIYDFDWTHLDIRYKNDNSGKIIDKPANLEKIYLAAKQLSQDFDYVRVDLYHDDDKVYFGELTFTPNDGTAKFTPSKVNYEWGSLWALDTSLKK